MSEHFITPEQLCIGLYIQLDLGWMDHPFTFNSFKIKSEDQLVTLRQLRLKKIRYDPAKSTAKPLAVSASPVDPPPAAEEVLPDVAQTMAKKDASIKQQQGIKSDIERMEKEFMRVADSVKNLSKHLRNNPALAAKEAEVAVTHMVEAVMSGSDIMLHAINEKLGEETYYHSLNVSVLSLMLAKSVGSDIRTLHDIGMGALLHDAGHMDVPARLLARTDLTKAEQEIYEKHCDYGAAIAAKMGMSPEVARIIEQHHESSDGTGFPRKLAGDAIIPEARIVCIANVYDELCNPPDIATALTPSETLAHMFALKRTKFDNRLLQLFIKRLGVYPPGSLVQLSNDFLGLVVSVNPAHPLRPNVLVYDPSIPKEDALIVSLLDDADIKVIKNLRPAQLPRHVHQYLNPRKNVTYFFDPTQRTSNP